MGIRAHPRLTSRETSLGHHGTQSRGCAGRRESCWRYSHCVYFLLSGGSREAIPSEPPSLTRGIGERGQRERDGPHPPLRDTRQTHWLIVAGAGEHGPGDARQLVGERDRHGSFYQDLSPDYLIKRDATRTVAKLARRIKDLEFEVEYRVNYLSDHPA